ncbi:hypothetical protein GCM10027289_20260 [Tsukamurella serpentis]
MHAAEQRPSRYAAPALAVATAATLAIAPLSSSTAIAAPTPPVVADLTGAAGAVANWLADSGLKFVTDPITGTTKLVENQIGNATVITDSLTKFGTGYLTGITKDLPAALAGAQNLIAAGKYGEAWAAVTKVFTPNIISVITQLYGPIMNQVGPQIGPFKDGIGALLLPMAGLLAPINALTDLPKAALDGIAKAAKALQAGDPAGAVTALLDASATVGKGSIDAMVSVLKTGVGMLTPFLKAMAGSSWATMGPFATAAGVPVTLAAASTGTGPTAIPALPGMPALPGPADLQKLVTLWQNALTGAANGLVTGPNSIPEMFKTLGTSVPAGKLVASFDAMLNVALAPVLPLGLAALGTGQAINPFLGPVGEVLGKVQNALLMPGLGVLGTARAVPTAVLTMLENVGKAVMAGDPFAVAKAISDGAAATVKAGSDGLFADGTGLIPGGINVVKALVDGISDAAPKPKPAAARESVSSLSSGASGAETAGSLSSVAGESGGASGAGSTGAVTSGSGASGGTESSTSARSGTASTGSDSATSGRAGGSATSGGADSAGGSAGAGSGSAAGSTGSGSGSGSSAGGSANGGSSAPSSSSSSSTSSGSTSSSTSSDSSDSSDSSGTSGASGSSSTGSGAETAAAA